MSNGINIDLTANLARWTSSLDRATQDLNRFQTNAQRISGTIGSIFSGLGVGLGVGAFTGIIKGSIDAADNLKDLSKSTGVAVSDLAGLKLAANQSGTNLEDVALAVNKLSVNIGKNGEKFRQLGIDAKDPLVAFQQLADVFVSINDPQQRAALGAAALGKSWATAAPLLAEGGAAIGQMVARGKELNPNIEKLAENSDRFNDALSDLGANLKGIAGSITGSILDGFTQLSDKISEASGKVKTFNSVLTGIGNFAFNQEGIRGLSVEIDNINNKIVSQKDKIAKLKDGGGLFALLSNDDINLEKNKLDQLLKQREDAVKQLQAERSKITTPISPSSQAVQNFIGGGTKERAPSVQRAARVRLTKEDTLSEEELAAYREFDQILEEGTRIAISQQNAIFDVTKQASLLKAELADFTPPASNDFEVRLYKIDDALKQGIFSAKEAKDAYDQLGQAFNNDVFEKGAESVTALSEFTIQASRNLQSSLADGLKNGFDGGLKGALTSLLTFLRDAAANIAASKILELVSGKDGKSGLLGSAISGIGNFLGNIKFFASGGDFGGGYRIVGENGPELQATGPARIFNAQETKNILSGGGGGGRSNSVIINFNGPLPTDRKAASQIAQQIGQEANRAINRNG